MESKKNEKANLENKKATFLFAGLFVTCAFVLILFEWSTFEKEKKSLGEVEMDALEPEVIPPSMKKPPPPKPEPTNQVEIVEDEEDIEKDLEIEDMEIDEDTKIDISEPKEKVKEKKVWSVVEDMPRFPGCEDVQNKAKRKKCAEKRMRKYIANHINYPQMAKDADIEGRVHVKFMVDEDGEIKNVKARNEIGGGCAKEAERVIKNMPDWIPGKQRGNPVRVNYTIPVTFELAN